MKQKHLILIPIVTLSFLVSCNNKSISKLKAQATSCTITFDATENGKFGNTSRYVRFSVPAGTELYPYINLMKEFEPISSVTNKVFACYSYKDNDSIIDYKDVVNNDITLEANYLQTGGEYAPYTNLNGFKWDFIKQVAVTKNNVSEIFALGATRDVELFNQSHKVRIIGYNHDKLASDSNEDIKIGLTFEFANLVTNADGTSLKTFWNEEPENKSSATNKFIGSTFYTLLNGEDGTGTSGIFNELPDDLKDATQLVTKMVGQGGDTTEEEEISIPYNTRLFPLGHAEMESGSYHGMPIDEGTLYQYYKVHATGDDRLKAPVGEAQSPGENYWLRSPYCINWTYYPGAWYVAKNSGVIANRDVCKTNATPEGIGFAPAFCI